ncbi:hypothetical protein JX265_007860 [Neoarthrinium moseri]|uniref:Cyanovirin-N domain-containing protein n=1 Tax=Neoarthrinium moseri TaxID=1658444 RepID=A0A9Q0AMY6_9PEZI|nr:uncharacterized protein JN550_003441 [Neoarthrinium moseri]KAI1866559.1 hypothetical protein JX265_007860 [Neoarthrinium moseri]KAI1873188.1 hypothetical protein JN550_003441 [Neoarthrinium moseri]
MHAAKGLLALLSAVAVTTIAATDLAFYEECIDWHTNGSFLIGLCPGKIARWFCLMNDDGELKAHANGDFSGSCNATYLQKPQESLVAACKHLNDSQAPHLNEFLLSNIYHDGKGMLKCGDNAGCYVGHGPACLGCESTYIRSDDTTCSVSWGKPKTTSAPGT